MPENEPVAPTIITMSELRLNRINHALQESRGVDISDFAAQRPADTYHFLKKAIDEAAESADPILVNGCAVSKNTEGELVVARLGRHAFVEIMSDADIEPVHVVVSIFKQKSRLDKLLGRGPQAKPLLSFEVEPPNLAF